MENVSYSDVDLIREVFHYQGRFEGSLMVFKIDYPITENSCFPGLVKDLALLAKTGFKVVIVPGAKENIDTVLKQYGISSSYENIDDFKIRITTKKAIPFVEMAAFDVASKFMTCLSGSRVEAVIGNFVRARGLGIKNGIDTEHTGTVDKIYGDSLKRLLDLKMVPILPCIGWSPAGKPYNVSSDEIALAVSSTLRAEKLFILSTPAKVMAADFYEQQIPDLAVTKSDIRQDGSLMRLTQQQVEKYIKTNINLLNVETEDTAKMQNFKVLKLALRASRSGIHRVHIINGGEEGSVLKELFSNLGTGTMLYTDEYDSIREFHSSDLSEILRLMEPLMQNGILVRRSSEQIQEKKDDYSVLEFDGSIRACGALHNWGENQGEIAAIATDPHYIDLGLGKKIVGFLIEKARKLGMKHVFVLTTQTHDWFESLGFKEADVESLPQQKRSAYDSIRNSKVFALNLS